MLVGSLGLARIQLFLIHFYVAGVAIAGEGGGGVLGVGKGVLGGVDLAIEPGGGIVIGDFQGE